MKEKKEKEEQDAGVNNRGKLLGYITKTPIYAGIVDECKKTLSDFYEIPFDEISPEQIKNSKGLLYIPVTIFCPHYKLASITAHRDKYLRWLLNDTAVRYRKTNNNMIPTGK